MTLFYFIEPSGPSSPPSLSAMSAALIALCTIAVALRVNVRKLQKANLKFDDWIMLPALLFFTGMAICGILGIGY